MTNGTTEFNTLQSRYKLQGAKAKALKRIDAIVAGAATTTEVAQTAMNRMGAWSKEIAQYKAVAAAGFQWGSQSITARSAEVVAAMVKITTDAERVNAVVSAAEDLTYVTEAMTGFDSGPEATLSDAQQTNELLRSIETRLKSLTGTQEMQTVVEIIPRQSTKLPSMPTSHPPYTAGFVRKTRQDITKTNYSKITDGGILFFVVSDDYDKTYADIVAHGDYPITEDTSEIKKIGNINGCERGKTTDTIQQCDGFCYYDQSYDDNNDESDECTEHYRLNGKKISTNSATLHELAQSAGCNNAARAIEKALAERVCPFLAELVVAKTTKELEKAGSQVDKLFSRKEKLAAINAKREANKDEKYEHLLEALAVIDALEE
jgi:hypothetical protein